MAGMEALGRLCNVVGTGATATNAIFKMRGASATMVIVTGATAVVAVAQDSTYGGGFATALACIKNVYWRVSPGDGTVVWNKLAYVSGNAPLSTYTHGTTTGLTTAVTSVFHIFTSEISDPYDYVKVTISGSGTASIIPVDLVHQRAPANLEIISS